MKIQEGTKNVGYTNWAEITSDCGRIRMGRMCGSKKFTLKVDGERNALWEKNVGPMETQATNVFVGMGEAKKMMTVWEQQIADGVFNTYVNANGNTVIDLPTAFIVRNYKLVEAC